MIVQIFVVLLISSIALICDVTGSSYSNVFVKSEVVPMEYYQYGTPYASVTNPRLSHINSLPSLPEYVAPCGSPCVYPAQTVATATSVNPIPNVLSYKAPVPNVPVVVTPTKEEATGYEYSYVVYDENTGDQKAQRELSDGSIVRGEYSFLQPDGYIREVQYVADDISGFNAVVKNLLPVVVEDKKKVDAKDKPESPPPCNEIKNEPLKEGSNEKLEEISVKQLMKIQEPTEKLQIQSKHPKEESEDEYQINNKSKKITNEDSDKVLEKETTGENEKRPKDDKKSKKESGDEPELEELKEKSRKKSLKESGEGSQENNKNKSKKESKEASDKHSEAKLEEKVSDDKNKEAHELLNPKYEAFVPYQDVLRCIQAAMRRNNGESAAMREELSPLTYIILNKPC